MCLTCRDQGLVNGCPACGKILVIDKPQIQLTTEILDKAAIPEFYKSNRWSKQVLLNAHKDCLAVSVLEKYAETLDRMYKIFASGKIPNKSCIIIASHCMGKMIWAYSCMQEALKYRYSVVPILDNTQYKRINLLSSDRMFSKALKQDYTIEDYNEADVMFMTIDPDNFQGSYRTVESVLSKRSRAGKPTFILSRYSIEQMSLIDYSHTFSSTVTAKAEQDRNKYVLVIGGN